MDCAFPLLKGIDLYDDTPLPEHIPGNPPNIWALHRYCTTATNAAYKENPVAIVWHFQLPSD